MEIGDIGYAPLYNRALNKVLPHEVIIDGREFDVRHEPVLIVSELTVKDFTHIDGVSIYDWYDPIGWDKVPDTWGGDKDELLDQRRTWTNLGPHPELLANANMDRQEDRQELYRYGYLVRAIKEDIPLLRLDVEVLPPTLFFTPVNSSFTPPWTNLTVCTDDTRLIRAVRRYKLNKVKYGIGAHCGYIQVNPEAVFNTVSECENYIIKKGPNYKGR